LFIYSIIVVQFLPNIGFVIVWTPWSTKDLVTKVISVLGILSIFTGGIGNTVVTVLVPSVIVWVPTSDIVCNVDIGLIF